MSANMSILTVILFLIIVNTVKNEATNSLSSFNYPKISTQYQNKIAFSIPNY